MKKTYMTPRQLVSTGLWALLLMGVSRPAFAQVKVGDNPTSISPSAILEAETTNKGYLKPRLTTAQRTAIASPAPGLEVYDTNTKSTWYYNGTIWLENGGNNMYISDGTLSGTRVVAQAANSLSFTGTATNAFSVDGTTFSVDAANHSVGFGTISPNANAAIDATAVNKGILLPRLTLSATNNASPLSAFVAGMTVYNTATAGTGATAVTPGLYYSDGSKWIATNKDFVEEPPIGCISIFAGNTLPTGYLVCNGAAISRSTYADLFAKIGTMYGAGDGSTTFNLPDLRGEFIRGWDNGRGVDAGRSLVSIQADATVLPNSAFVPNTVSHTHSLNPGSAGSTSAGAHTHSFSRRSNSDNVSYDTGNARAGENSAMTTDRAIVGSFSTASAGAHTHALDIAAFNSSAAGSHTHTVTGGGDAETRPRNVAMVYAIKVTQSVSVSTPTATAIAAVATANEPWYKVGTSTGATANTDNVYINGNVGIGTTTPQARLFVTQAPGATTNLLTAEINNCGTPCGEGTARNIVLSNSNGTNGATFASLDFVPGTVSTSPSGASIIGIDRDGTNNYAGLQFWTRNATDYAARITIKSSGNVGIGTTAPTSTLTVGNAAGTVAGGTVFINPENAATEGGQIVLAKDLTYGSTNYALDQYGGNGTATNPARFRIYNTGGERFVIMDNGNVGIGTINPASKLDVNGSITGNGNYGFVLNSSDGNGGGFIHTSGEASDTNGLVFENNRGTGKIIFNTNSGTVAERMRVTFEGKVGIGTPLPTQTLTIGNTAGTNPGLLLVNPQNTTDAGGQITLAKDVTYGTADWRMEQYGGDGTATNLPRFRILGAGIERMVITENWNVGIGGGINPSTPLEVNGAIRVGTSAQTATAAGAGAIRYNAGVMQYSNGTTWLAATGAYAWSAPAAMGLATTAGTLTTGTVNKNQVRYRKTADDTEVLWEFSCAAGGTGTAGSYLFTLPAGVTFNLTRFPAYTALTGQSDVPTAAQLLAMGPSMIPVQGTYLHELSGAVYLTKFYVVPYSSNRFRILGDPGSNMVFMTTSNWAISASSKPFLSVRFFTGNP